MQSKTSITGALLFLLLLWGCANQRPLQGGDKDGVAPNVVAMMPAMLTTNFNSQTIEIVFDEYVDLNNIYDELIISPPLKTRPEIVVKKKSVILKIKEELKPNTTYTFNFGDGIADINELNKAKDLIYVFSTGNSIDSLGVAGNLMYPFSNEPAGNVKVMLFEDTVDLTSVKTPVPSYFAKSNSDGQFVIRYLPSGNFNALALEDLNGNYAIDEDERVSLIQKNVQPSVLDSTTAMLSFNLTTQPVTQLNMAEIDVDSMGFFAAPWNKTLKTIDLKAMPLNEALRPMLVWNAKMDSVFCYLIGDVTEKREKVAFGYGDDLDTLEVPFFKEAYPDEMKVSHGLSTKIAAKSSISFQMRALPDSVNWEKTMLYRDSIPLGSIYANEDSPIHFTWDADLTPASKYTLKLMPGTFTDVLGHTNDTLEVKFATYRNEDLGQLTLSIPEFSRDAQVIIQMMDSKDKVYREFVGPYAATLKIENIVPGEYTFRYFRDDNSNGIWDPIDFKNQLPEENIHYQKEKVNVRANWELKLALELGI